MPQPCCRQRGDDLWPVISLLVWLRRSEPLIRFIGWACIVSLGLNAQRVLNDPRGLRIGYYFWGLSLESRPLAVCDPPKNLCQRACIRSCPFEA